MRKPMPLKSRAGISNSSTLPMPPKMLTQRASPSKRSQPVLRRFKLRMRQRPSRKAKSPGRPGVGVAGRAGTGLKRGVSALIMSSSSMVRGLSFKTVVAAARGVAASVAEPAIKQSRRVSVMAAASWGEIKVPHDGPLKLTSNVI